MPEGKQNGRPTPQTQQGDHDRNPATSRPHHPADRRQRARQRRPGQSAFLNSVHEHGVLQPITAVPTAAGIEVRDGQRRTLAAREAKLATIPVYVLDAEDTTPGAAERIAHHIVANDQRSALTDAQRARGINQMLLARVSPAKVAKKLSVGRDTVDAAASVTESATALGALESGQLSLAEAAALTDFEDDDEAAQELLAVAGTRAFDHRVAQLRQDRIAAKARAEAETTYAEQGFAILAERPAWRDTSHVALRHLQTADGQETTDAAVTDPAQWAVLLVEDTVLVDAVTGRRGRHRLEHRAPPRPATRRRRPPRQHGRAEDRVGARVLLPRPASLRPSPGGVLHPRTAHRVRTRRTQRRRNGRRPRRSAARRAAKGAGAEQTRAGRPGGPPRLGP